MGAERFGWSRRNPTPGSMRDGDYLIGWGMATATYPGYRAGASAKAQLFASGRAVISSATHDIGTGMYTVMTQIAADVLGLPVLAIEFQLGDSSMPVAPLAGGSHLSCKCWTDCARSGSGSAKQGHSSCHRW